ncbi:MAG: LuxR superfamily regulatory protein [Cyanobacteria bacterium RYN_339]|nr:LuxR superfamily regulatory protein [Cyanobacteria bacterium RYN_339]
MSAAVILETKLLPPPPPPHWQRRPLVAPIPPVVLLEAGPGDGKTTALLELTTQLAAAGKAVVWLTLDELDADPATLFAYLVAGVRRHDPAFGEAVLAAIPTTPDSRVLWRLFLVHASTLSQGLVLALDDADRANPVALGGQLDRLPPNVHVLVASRQRLGWPIQRLLLAGTGKLLGPAALHFDPATAAAYAAARGQAATAWPLGLQPGAEAYLAEVQFQPQPEDTRRFMLQAALLEPFTPELLRTVLDDPQATTRLDGLAACFAVDGERFAAPLGAFLRKEAARTLGEARELHAKAARFHQAAGHVELAWPHLLAARDFEAARGALTHLLAAGRLDELATALAAFPAGDDALPWIWRGEVEAHRGRPVDALAAFQKARELTLEAPLQFQALAATCAVAACLADREPYNAAIADALTLQAEGRPVDRARLHLARARAAALRQDWDLTRECHEAVLAIPAGVEAPLKVAQARARLALGELAGLRGDHVAARRFLALARELAVEANLPALGVAVDVARADQALREGALDDAEALLAPLAFTGLDARGAADLRASRGALALARGDTQGTELTDARVTLEAAADDEGLRRLRPRLVQLALARGEKALAEKLRAGPESPWDAVLPTPTATTSQGLDLSVLGRFDVRVDGAPRTAWPRRKAKVLLGALLLRREGGKSMELAELLGEGDAMAGAEIYKVNVRALRQTLEPGRDKGETSRFLEPTGGGYALRAVVGFDLDAFEAAAKAAQKGDKAAAQQALALYQGDLFGEDRAGEYFELEREDLRSRALALAREVAAACLASKDRPGAEAALQQACAISPCDEDTYLALMRFYREGGQPDRIATAYWACHKAMKRQLGIAPGEDFERAYKRVVSG